MVEPDGARGRADVRPSLGRRPGAGRRWHGPTVSRICAPAPRAASANGRSAEVGPGRLVPWLAIAFGFGIVALFHRRARAGAVGGGRAARRCDRCAAVAACGTGRSPFPSRSASRRSRRALRPRRSSARSSRIRCCRRRPGTSTSRASSRRARSASAPTASWCASTASTGRGSTRSPSACGCRCARARRRRSAASSSSRRGSRRRSSRCGRAATTSRATCISSGIGASGFVLGAHPDRRGAGDAPALWLRYATVIDGMREAIDKRIRAVAAGRQRRDRVGADHRQARRASRRRSTTRCTSPSLGARAVDLRLSHGGGRGRRVLRRARAARADARLCQPPSDQEMGGARGARRGRRSICCCRAPRSRRSAPSS